ncbi:MAG: isocitrate dehydrogenase (NADP(+)) [Acidobacteriota bacterium]
MAQYKHLKVPTGGETIEFSDGQFKVPDRPVIPFIEGDGIGPDIWKATRRVVDSAVEKLYGGRRRIVWFEALAGEKAKEMTDEWLPDDTLKAIDEFSVAIKGPLTTPVGGGIRSLNVTLRQVLDLYACVRPVRYIEGVPAPVREPEKMNVVIFRENTEDVYAGIEWPEGSKEAKDVIEFLATRFGIKVRPDSGIGIKPISVTATKNLVRKAMRHCIEQKRPRLTLVHKGNIMKFTEGAFRDWGYDLVREEFRDVAVTEEEVTTQHEGKAPAGKIVVNDRIADAMFQQVLLRPDEYDVLATPNLNGDYLSDACAAQVGGLGMAPGANIGARMACFEATHGTAPKYAGKDMVNPGSLLLSALMMLEYLGWNEASEVIYAALGKTIRQKKVTYDLERQMEGATRVSTSQFAQAIIENL